MKSRPNSVKGIRRARRKPWRYKVLQTYDRSMGNRVNLAEKTWERDRVVFDALADL